MKFLLAAFSASAMLSSLALGQVSHSDAATANHQLSSADTAFLKKLAEGNLGEVDAGKLASTKASDQEVKDFGEHMVKDHSKNQHELSALAKTYGVELPTSADSEQLATKSKLQSASARSFDSLYIKDQVEDHEKDVRLLENGIQNAQNASVREFAQKTLQVVKHHLTMAKQLQAKLPSAVAERSQ
jgi:putative membrane protein